MVTAIKAQGALPLTMAPKGQEVKASDGKASVKPDHHLDGMRSTMFDAIYVPGGEESVDTLLGIGLARFWVREAFGHCKAIAAAGEGILLVNAAVKEAEGAKLASKRGEVVEWYGVVTAKLWRLCEYCQRDKRFYRRDSSIKSASTGTGTESWMVWPIRSPFKLKLAQVKG